MTPQAARDAMGLMSTAGADLHTGWSAINNRAVEAYLAVNDDSRARVESASPAVPPADPLA